MRYATIVIAAATAVVLTVTAEVGAVTIAPERAPGSCNSRAPRYHVGEAKDTLDRIYAHRKWRREDLSTARTERRWRFHRRCNKWPVNRERVTTYKRRKQESREHWRKRKIRQHESGGSWCSPDPHPAGSGCWEIPTSCVMSESGGSWGAYNPSGAVGPYQLLGHGAPFPVTSRRQARQHHAIAESLYRSSGLAPWVAPGC